MWNTSSQIAFWLFVMKDAIELHTVRTLALIASAPQDVRQRLSDELACTPLTAGGIARLHLLEACIKEALRLWTPVPILLRVALETHRTVRQCAHRERPANPHAHRVISSGPRRIWRRRRHVPPGTTADRGNARLLPGDTDSNPPLYVFSQHQQSCSGQFLIIFLLKAVLASLLVKTNLLLLGKQISMDPVPAAIDHFAIRFWRADPMPGLFHRS